MCVGVCVCEWRRQGDEEERKERSRKLRQKIEEGG